MITRAQAEALLPLAESLEACERLGVNVRLGDYFADITYAEGADWQRVYDLDGMSIRLAINALIPKQESKP